MLKWVMLLLGIPPARGNITYVFEAFSLARKQCSPCSLFYAMSLRSALMISTVMLLGLLRTGRSSARCNIPRQDLELSLDERGELALPDTPLIFVDSGRNSELRRLTLRSHLLEHYGSEIVTLSSSNTYSHDTVRWTLGEYIAGLSNETASSDASKNYYLFGGNYNKFWKHLEGIYEGPPCRHCLTAGARTPGLGGNCSGVAFHMHGPGFSEVLHGRKLWLLYPPDTYPKHFSPDMSTCEWYTRYYAEVVEDPHLHECSIGPGEILYFPDRWVHATLNLDEYTFFMSLFLDKSLFR